MSVAEAFDRLCTMTRRRCNVEDGALDLNGSPTAEQLQEAQAEMSLTFPLELLELYSMGNGQRSVFDVKCGPFAHDMLAGTQLLSLKYMMECRKVLKDRAACADESVSHSNQFVQQTYWSDLWLPVGSSCEFGSVALMDLSPSPTGVARQIFFLTEPYVVSGIVAVGMADFMNRCADRIPDSGMFQWSSLPAIDPNTGAEIASSSQLS